MVKPRTNKRKMRILATELIADKSRRFAESTNLRIWSLPNSQTVHVLQPEKPSKGGPPPLAALKLIEELGMPPKPKWNRLRLDGAQLSGGGHDSERWRDYRLEFFGMVVKPSSNGPNSWPYWKITDPSGRVADLVIQLWRQVITHLSSPLYSEILWHPERGRTISIRGLEKPHSGLDLSRAWRGIQLLESFVPQGRRPGTTILTTEEFRLRAPIACRHWMDEYDGKCTDLALAEALDIGKSTLYTYMKRAKLSMKLIREQARTLAI